MQLKQLFHETDFLIGLNPTDKWDAIGKMMEHLVEVGRCSAEQADTLHEAVLARERSMSTGMERGVAIPGSTASSTSSPVSGSCRGRTASPSTS